MKGMRPALASLALAAAGAVAGCFPESTYDCDQDFECSGGEVCARTHECLTPSQVRGLRVVWTVTGSTDVATACETAGLGGLTISYTAPGVQTLQFAPVACTLGLYAIDKLPVWFERVELSGYGSGDAYYEGSVMIGAGPEVQIAL
jgi:hypothetical protein